MKRVVTLAVLAGVIGLSAASLHAAQPKVESRTLKCGLRLCYLHVPKSQHVCIFTYLPMGLAYDEPERASWAHLIEHLVIRTTMPDDLEHANAETLADHMRLDFYGTAENWREGLSHHERWLQGLPFDGKILKREKSRANAEADSVVPRLLAHKFAFAAWGQVYRHGRTHVAVKGDLDNASLKDLEQYRDQHLFVPAQSLVCAIGGVEPETFLKAAEESLGRVTTQAKPLAEVKVQPGEHYATWDVAGRHLVLSWPIPGPEKADDHAALLLASNLVTLLVFQDADIQKLGGLVFAGSDLVTPEGCHFYLSIALRSGASSADLRKRLHACTERLAKGEAGPAALFGMPTLRKQLAQNFQPIDPEAIKKQLPAGMAPWMAEANAGLFWGLHEFRYGDRKQALSEQLKKTTIAGVQRVAKAYLTPEQCTTVVLEPKQGVREPGKN